MATRLGIRELRDNLPATMRRVRAGETIEVTHHGVPIAVISPVAGSRMAQLIASGAVTPGKPLDRPIKTVRARGPMTASDWIEDDRSVDR